MSRWLIDTGPLVALLVRTDHHHDWARQQLHQAPPAVTTCDAVISESLFLLKRAGHDCEMLFDLMATGFLRSDFSLSDEQGSIRQLMRSYADLPTSFADACMVRMCELEPDSLVWTLDRNFHIYRRFKNRKIPLIIPD